MRLQEAIAVLTNIVISRVSNGSGDNKELEAIKLVEEKLKSTNIESRPCLHDFVAKPMYSVSECFKCGELNVDE